MNTGPSTLTTSTNQLLSIFKKLKEKCNVSLSIYVVLTVVYFLLILFLIVFVNFTFKKFIELENGMNEILGDLDEMKEKYEEFQNRMQQLGLSSILNSD